MHADRLPNRFVSPVIKRGEQKWLLKRQAMETPHLHDLFGVLPARQSRADQSFHLAKPFECGDLCEIIRSSCDRTVRGEFATVL